MVLASIDYELWRRQAQNGVNLAFQVKFDLEGQGQSPPKTIGTSTKLFCTFCPHLVVLAWTRRDLWRGQARGWRTHTQTDTHTDRQTQATTIPEGQNWPRVTNHRPPHRGPFHEIIIPSRFKFNGKLFSVRLHHCISYYYKMLHMHNSTAVVSCAKFCSNHFTINLMRTQLDFHRVWITMEKMLKKWAPAPLKDTKIYLVHCIFMVEPIKYEHCYPPVAPFTNMV